MDAVKQRHRFLWKAAWLSPSLPYRKSPDSHQQIPRPPMSWPLAFIHRFLQQGLRRAPVMRFRVVSAPPGEADWGMQPLLSPDLSHRELATDLARTALGAPPCLAPPPPP